MEILTEQANKIANILVEENILNRNNDVYGALDLRGFINSVIEYPESDGMFGYLELTYHTVNTRIIVKYRKQEGANVVHSIEAFAYRGETTEGVDYKRVNARLEEYVG